MRMIERLGVDLESLSTSDVERLLDQANFHGVEREHFIQGWEKKTPAAYAVLEQIFDGFCWIAGEWRQVTSADVDAASERLGQSGEVARKAEAFHQAVYAQSQYARDAKAYRADPVQWRAARQIREAQSDEMDKALPAAGEAAGDGSAGTPDVSSQAVQTPGTAVSGAPATEFAAGPAGGDEVKQEIPTSSGAK